MKKLEGLTLSEIKEKWVEGVRYYRKPKDGEGLEEREKLYHNPAHIFQNAIANDWILELPDKKPMTDEEILEYIDSIRCKTPWAFSEAKTALKLARESDRLRYQPLRDAAKELILYTDERNFKNLLHALEDLKQYD